MKRIAMAVVAALLAAGCGSDSSTPTVTQVVVTVRQAGVVVQGATVYESSGMNRAVSPAVPTGIITSLPTNASGQTAAFAVPGSTDTGSLCFSVTVTHLGATSSTDDCRTLNLVSATLVLDLL